MGNRYKRFLALLLTVVMMLNMLPIAVLANGETEATEPTTMETSEETTEETTEETAEGTAKEPVEEELPLGDSIEEMDSAPIYKFNGYKTLEDFGIRSASAFSLRRNSASSGYLNPQTIRPDSSLYGYRWIYSANGSRYPFTASFTLDEDYMPQNSVYIAIANYDCDEYGNSYSREYDQVYINGHCVGVLTGNNNTSNTTLLKVDKSYLKAGTNEIVIRVGIEIREYGARYWDDTAGKIYADDPYDQWVLRVDDIQLLCDGGSAEGRPDVFRVNLTNAELSGNQVNCSVTTQVEDSQNRTFSLEYALYDWSSEESATYGQIIDDDFATITKDNYQHNGSLTMPVDSLSGTYTAVVYLKVKENGKDTILAYDEESFDYETGIAPAFDIQNLTAMPATLELTSEPVDINLSADIDINAGLTNLEFHIADTHRAEASVDENGHVTGVLTLTENGFYTIELCYTKDGKNYRKTTTIEINNILDEPETSGAEILKAGRRYGNNYVVGSTYDYIGTYSFWAATSVETEEVCVYVNGELYQTLKADASQVGDNNIRMYTLDIKLNEGMRTISFRTKDGASEAKIYFGAISNIDDCTMYAIGKTVGLKTWPSKGATIAVEIPLDTKVKVLGEIDVSTQEGYYYISYNGKNYFVNKEDVADTTLEKQFREFVKGVSDKYYRDIYDYNKYYYLASDVKYTWDNKLSHRNDAYSTAERNSQYNIQSIQQMLIDGVQQKADTVTKNFAMSSYMEGMGFNPVTGNWEVNEKAVMSQKMYNEEVSAAIEEAMNEWGMAMVNATIDAIVLEATGGNMTDDTADLIELCTTVYTDVLNIYAKIKHERELDTLKNLYRDMMKQAVVDMYDNIDQQISEEYRSLLKNLQDKEKKPNMQLTDEEELLKQQLEILINALDKQKAAWKSDPPEEVREIYEEATDELVNSIGLELREEITEKEVAKRVVVEVSSSILLNVLDLFADKWLEGKIDNDVVELMIDYFKTSLMEAVDTIIDDWNNNGSLSMDEIISATLSSLSFLLNDDHIEDLCNKFYDACYKNGIAIDSNKLAELKKHMKILKDDLLVANRKYDAHPNKQVTQNTLAEKELAYIDEFEGYDVSQKTYNDTLEKAQNKVDNMEMNSIIAEDIIAITLTTLNAAKEAAGIGDMADNEVYYAYCANYMAHVMESTEIRRDSLDQAASKKMQNHSYIDIAPIEDLKAFVNKVYTVYNYDILGHSQYMSLALGWEYVQSGQKERDWEAERERLEWKLIMNADYTKLEGLYVAPTLLIMDLTILFGRNSQSEYLKALNDKHEEVAKAGSWVDKFENQYTFDRNMNGIPSVSETETVYNGIGTFVNATRLPEKFNVLS